MGLSYVFMIFFILFISVTDQKPHIFSEIDTCEISVQKEDKPKYHVVPAKIDASSGDFQVTVLLCDKYNYLGRRKSQVSTISVLKQRRLYLNDTSLPKPYEASEDKKYEIFIQLQNEIKCNEDQNYDISIKMRQAGSKVPRLTIDTDNCAIEIEVARHDYSPSCTAHIENKWFIDLNPLRNKQIDIINKMGERYILSLCRPLSSCQQQVGCKIGVNNESHIIGYSQNLRVSFSNGIVQVNSKINKNKESMTIDVKCRWDIPYFSKPKLLNDMNNVKHHKFEVYSSFGCVKMPIKCVLTDENTNLFFDLTDLSPSSGTVVGNTSRRIRLNICNDLKMSLPRNWKKALENTQVVETIGNSYRNRGRIPTIKWEGNSLKAQIMYGDKCNENETFSTSVDLKCSKVNSGPIFVSEEGCTMKLLWNTPKACPKVQIIEKGCSFSTVYGRLNLLELYRSEGFTSQISPRQKLIYNVCGKIQSKCSGFDDVAVCFLDGSKQKVIGWEDPTVTFINGEIKLDYTGEKCGSENIPYSFTMVLVCSYEEDKREPIIQRIDDCKFKSTFYTSAACLKSWEIKECVVDDQNYVYDLRPLMRRRENYRIEDRNNRDITYFLNLCVPLLPEKDILFYANSMVYMVNNSIPSIKDKSTVIGYNMGTSLKDNKLVAEAGMGEKSDATTICSSRINFECSEKDESPYLLKSQGCSVDFMWRTKHACPIMKKGGTCHLTDGENSAEVPGDPMEVKLNNQNTYSFSLCLDYYKWCNSDGNCVTKKLSKSILIQNGVLSLQYTLDQSGPLQTVRLRVECDFSYLLNYTVDYLGRNQPRNQLNLSVKSRLFCKNGENTQSNIRSEQKRDESYEYKIVKEPNNKNLPNEETVVKIRGDDNEHEKRKLQTEIAKTEKVIKTEEAKTEKFIKTEEAKTEKVIKTEEAKTEKFIKTEEVKTEKVIKTEAPHPSETIVNFERKICKVADADGNKIDLYKLNGTEFQAGNDFYIFNYDGTSSKCEGLICKNGDAILSFIEKCPEVSQEDGRTVLTYTTGGQCVTDHAGFWANMIVEVSLGCKKDGVAVEASDENCKISFKYTSPKLCEISKSSNSFIIVIVCILGSIVLLICCITLMLYKKDYFKNISNDRISERDALVVHSKML